MQSLRFVGPSDTDDLVMSIVGIELDGQIGAA